jgi:hypothetical protein
VVANVPKKCIASNFYPEDERDTFLRNVSNHLEDYTATEPEDHIHIFAAVKTSNRPDDRGRKHL